MGRYSSKIKRKKPFQGACDPFRVETAFSTNRGSPIRGYDLRPLRGQLRSGTVASPAVLRERRRGPTIAILFAKGIPDRASDHPLRRKLPTASANAMIT